MIRMRVDKRELPSDDRWRVIMDIKKRVDDREGYYGNRYLMNRDKQELKEAGMFVSDAVILEECVANKYGGSCESDIVPVVNAVEGFLNICDELLEGYSGEEFEEILTKTPRERADLERMLRRVSSMLCRIRKIAKMMMEARRFLIEEYDVKKKRSGGTVAYRGGIMGNIVGPAGPAMYNGQIVSSAPQVSVMQKKPAASTVEEDPTWKLYEQVLEKVDRQIKKFDVLLTRVAHNG